MKEALEFLIKLIELVKAMPAKFEMPEFDKLQKEIEEKLRVVSTDNEQGQKVNKPDYISR